MTLCRCIPKKQVCLTSFGKFKCSQHECVPRQLNCDQTRDPVCDTDNVEYNNLCTLYQKGKTLAYRGPCQVGSGSSNIKSALFFNVPLCNILFLQFTKHICRLQSFRTVISTRIKNTLHKMVFRILSTVSLLQLANVSKPSKTFASAFLEEIL